MQKGIPASEKMRTGCANEARRIVKTCLFQSVVLTISIIKCSVVLN
jgi:hypothetical protein